MATQTLEFSAGTGLTISCKLFAVGSDTVVATATATEKTNNKSRYAVAYTDIPAGAYVLNGFVSGVGGFAAEVYDLTLTTSTFYPRAEASLSVTTTVTPLAAGDVQRVDGTTIQVFQGEAVSHTVASITDSSGDPVVLTGKTLELVIDHVPDARTGSHEDFEVLAVVVDSADTISFTNTALSTATTGRFRWACREPSNGNYVWARGVWEVISVATEDV